MKKQILFFLAFIITIASDAKTITGVIKNASTGEVVINSRIKNLADDKIVLSNENGEFSIDINENPTNTLVIDHPAFIVQEIEIKQEKNLLINLTPRKLSSATARWLNYIESEKAYNTLQCDNKEGWNIEFIQENLKGDFAPDSTLIRRDPSAVIKVNGKFYTYYTYGTRYRENGDKKFFPWDECDIWYATSEDGYTWKEQGPCVKRGPKGSFDDASVFTPEILAHDGKYYLVYQCVQNPYVYRVKNTVGMAYSSSPDGPWTKLEKPILSPTNNGEWDKTDEFKVTSKGDFDSHKVHDPCLLFYKGKYYLYYKGERMGEERMFGQREIKWGVAIAENPLGPYVKSPYNPITNSGHEVCVWPYKGGIALIHTDDGPERHTIQWSSDGINFEVMGKIGDTPKAFGIYRTEDHDKSPTEGIRWGLCHSYGDGSWRTSYNYIKRFDIK